MLLNENSQNKPEKIANIAKIPNIIVEYKKENQILSKQKIYCCLADEVLFFKPEIQIKSKGIISGMNKEIQTGKNLIHYFLEMSSLSQILFTIIGKVL